ncbi:tetratricopeptide repeat protein [Solilutibacter silvestris]|uniref:Tetratricopeptide repeat n=1 Tax=Solilutibacter silvestris TaxID=1645665 RepID=A0A2K1PZM0_9GAMM|nr:tetratricopeptide repeat protein [Lysobacter silvestris]PNS08238.1 Tetratricopeptide repeat [Lysobacter silvestris]
MKLFLVITIVASLLLLAFVLRPLWSRARPLAIALGGSGIFIALALYWILGTPLALDPAMRRAPATIDEAAAQLQARLALDPTNADAWRVLAQTYAAQGRHDKAADAASRAATLKPNDPDILVAAAEARALAAPEHRFDAQGLAWLDAAIARNPHQQRALWFKGIALRQAGRDADAVAVWESLLPLVDAKAAAVLGVQIDAARVAAKLPPRDHANPPAANGVQVRVAIDPGVDLGKLDPSTPVFVIARQIGGPPMPVAVEKHMLSELPLTLTLDDRDSPMPTARLSTMKTVEMLARISRSGSATRGDGDIETAPVRVDLPARVPVELHFGK